MNIGDYFVAESAVCADGFSWILGYEPLSTISANKELFNKIIPILHKLTSSVQHGKSFTTASFVQENDPSFWDMVPKDVKVIEMSSAALYAAAEKTGKKACAFFWVTDLPLEVKSFYDAFSESEKMKKQQRHDQQIQISIDLISQI